MDFQIRDVEKHPRMRVTTPREIELSEAAISKIVNRLAEVMKRIVQSGAGVESTGEIIPAIETLEEVKVVNLKGKGVVAPVTKPVLEPIKEVEEPRPSSRSPPQNIKSRIRGFNKRR